MLRKGELFRSVSFYHCPKMRHVPTLLICWRYFEMVSSKRLSQPWISQFLMHPEPNAVNSQLGISVQFYRVPKYNIRSLCFLTAAASWWPQKYWRQRKWSTSVVTRTCLDCLGNRARPKSPLKHWKNQLLKAKFWPQKDILCVSWNCHEIGMKRRDNGGK